MIKFALNFSSKKYSDFKNPLKINSLLDFDKIFSTYLIKNKVFKFPDQILLTFFSFVHFHYFPVFWVLFISKVSPL